MSGADDRADLLTAPHMRALSMYVQGLRSQERGVVPDFDPLDGGVEARLLLVLEKPGPRMAEDAGFVSRDNATGTARAIRAGMCAAGVPRRGTVIWNAVPWWNGVGVVRAAEKRAGQDALGLLLPLLPRMRSVVLAGRVAQETEPVFSGAAVQLFECVHPSPQARAGPVTAVAWRELPRIWAHAWQAAERPLEE